MDDNKFFKLVWRINGLTILVVGFLSLIVLLYVVYESFSFVTRDRSVRNIVNIEDAKDIKEELHFGHMSEIKGSSYVLIPLISDQNYSQVYFSKSSSSARNYLFLNSNTNEKTWLLRHNNFLFDDNDILYKKNDIDDEDKPLAHLFEIIKTDTNSDKRLNRQDLMTIALSKIDGTNYIEVIEDINSYIGHKVNDNGSLLVLYKKGGVAYSANIDLSDFKIINETVLSQ